MRAKIKSILFASATLLFAVCLLIIPTETVEASKRGIDIWASSVFPSLLPFFVTGELLISFGVVHFIGVLLEPVMRPLFNVPGIGGFVWAIGLSSGYPAGANFTARMRQEGYISRIEAERLVAFTNASNPIFIIAVVAVSFLNEPRLGLLLATVHYGSNLCVGIIMRFYQQNDEHVRYADNSGNIFKKAFNTLHDTRLKQHKPFGKLLGDAVVKSIESALMIGGFILIFSVVSTILIETNLLVWVSELAKGIFTLIRLPDILALPFSVGIVEITLGIKQIAQFINHPLIVKTLLISILLAFNGLSVHAQVASILADTDIRYKAYLFGRFIQIGFATILVILIFPLINLTSDLPIGEAVPVLNIISNHFWQFVVHVLANYGALITILGLWTYLIIKIYRQLTVKRESQ